MISRPIYSAEILATEDRNSSRIVADFDSRSQALIFATNWITTRFPDTDICDVAAELWSREAVELSGYKIRIHERLCACVQNVLCSFCDWRRRARRIRPPMSSPRKGALVSICEGYKSRRPKRNSTIFTWRN